MWRPQYPEIIPTDQRGERSALQPGIHLREFVADPGGDALGGRVEMKVRSTGTRDGMSAQVDGTEGDGRDEGGTRD